MYKTASPSAIADRDTGAPLTNLRTDFVKRDNICLLSCSMCVCVSARVLFTFLFGFCTPGRVASSLAGVPATKENS